MEINEYPRTPLQSNRTKQNILRKSAASEYETSQIKANQIKPSGHEIRPAQINKGENSIIKGEIIDLRYQEVKIRLEPGGQVITAKLSGEVPLSIGQTAEFAVSDETDGQITLRYISAGDSSVNDIAQRALSASGLSASDRNLSIVQELLNFHMPVDKNTILHLIKLTASYPDASLTTLVLMHKHQLPINIGSIAQFEAYHDNMHQILSQLKSLIGNITDFLASDTIMPENDSIHTDILYQQNYDNPEDLIQGKNTIEHDEIINAEKNIEPEELFGVKGRMDSDSVKNPLNDTNSMGGIYPHDKIHPDNTISLFRELLSLITEGESLPVQIVPDTPIRSVFSEDELMQLRNALLSKLAETDYAENDTVHSIKIQLTDGSMTLEKLLSIVHDLYGNESDPAYTENTLPVRIIEAFVGMSGHLSDGMKEKLRHFLKSETSQELIADTLHNRWTLSPEEIPLKDKVTKFFKRLDEDMEHLKRLTDTAKSFDTQEVKASINKLQDNLQFMRELNELFLYLQLPMRLTGQDTHGDLYVFTRKNGRNHDSLKLNVLLHLDMANLGSMDIHMTMNNRQVSAVFYMEEASEQIIAGHLHELIDTLVDKGYQFQAKTRISDTKPDFITDILHQNTPSQSTHRYSFDIRA